MDLHSATAAEKQLISNLVFITLFFSFALFVPLYSQIAVDNPAKPANPKSFRIVELKEVMRITDESGEYYFKYPSSIKIAFNENIFVQDDHEFLQFDKNGRFIRNLFKKGQGPNEIDFMGQYQLGPDYIIVHCTQPNKVLWFNYNGQVIKEIIIHQRAEDFRFLHADRYYFLTEEFPKLEKREEIFELNFKLISFSEDGKDFKTIMSFPAKFYGYSEGGARAFIPIEKALTAPYQNRFLFINHTSEYQVKVFDSEINQLIRSFRRKYQRVDWDKNRIKSHVMFGNKTINPPPQKYENDIRDLWVNGDRLWVITSTFKKDKGFLIDVFDIQGRFLDSFFLYQPHKARAEKMHKMMDYPIKAMTVDGEFFYTAEEDDEGNLAVVKYKMENLFQKKTAQPKESH